MRTKLYEPKYFLLFLTSQVARKLTGYYNRELAELGLTSNQMLCLGVLWYEEGVSLGVFAERAGLGKAAAVSMVKRLEKMGLVRRRPNLDDARLNALYLTDKARRLAPKLSSKVGQLEDELERSLGIERTRALHEALRAIKAMDF